MSEEQTPEQLQVLWKAYKDKGDRTAREKLILHYAKLVKFVAGRLGTGLPPNVETSDLISYGIFGLIDAIEKFEPSRNIKFETYAISRIKGSIIDELRSLDWVPRSLRQKAKEMEAAMLKLEDELGREPSDKEMAEKLRISAEEYMDLLMKLNYTTMIALEELWVVGGERGDRICLIDSLEDANAVNPEESFELEELKVVLAKAIDRLSDREKKVVSLYYYEGLTLKEIGQALGVTESRISQLHTKAIMRLRARILEAQHSSV